MGKRVYCVLSTSSTQDLAKDLIKKGISEEGTLIIASSQKEGRGRWGKEWFSPKGGLWFSLILRNEELKEREEIILNAAFSLSEAIKEVSGLSPQIKLPNDILIEGKKVSGLLLETYGKYLIMGAGVNVNFSSSLFPDNLVLPASTLLELCKKRISRKSLLSTFLVKFESRLQSLSQDVIARGKAPWQSHTF